MAKRIADEMESNRRPRWLSSWRFLALMSLVIANLACLPRPLFAEDSDAKEKIRALMLKLRDSDARSDHRDKELWGETYKELRGLPETTVENMLPALADSDDYVRACAVAILAELKDRRAVDALQTALSDKSVYVRACSAVALGEIGDPQAVPALIKTLDDEDIGVRRQAAEALGRMPDPRATKPLIANIKEKKDNRFCALDAPSVVIVMWEHCRSGRDGRNEEPSPWALTQIGEPAVDDLLASLQDPNCDENAYSLLAWALEKIRR